MGVGSRKWHYHPSSGQLSYSYIFPLYSLILYSAMPWDGTCLAVNLLALGSLVLCGGLEACCLTNEEKHQHLFWPLGHGSE